ncbi:hypothetical protein GCM10023168_18970 [Fodinibacter luteus]|uniref:Uncharacterized protein n=1 Tax=Fodinibacter luteus TaxID=552064 RepID=A0ABP8KEH4_9MICO
MHRVPHRAARRPRRDARGLTRAGEVPGATRGPEGANAVEAFLVTMGACLVLIVLVRGVPGLQTVELWNRGLRR